MNESWELPSMKTEIQLVLTDSGSILELDLDTGEASQVGTVEDNTTIFGAAALPDGFFEDNPLPVDSSRPHQTQ